MARPMRKTALLWAALVFGWAGAGAADETMTQVTDLGPNAAVCQTLRLAIHSALDLSGTSVIPDLKNKPLIIVNSFDASGKDNLNRPKKTSRKDWKKLKQVDASARPDACGILNADGTPASYAPTRTDASFLSRTHIIVRIWTARAAPDNQSAALSIRLDELGRTTISGTVRAFYDGAEWTHDPVGWAARVLR